MTSDPALERARNRAFVNYVARLHEKGYSDQEIAIDLAISPEQLKEFTISINEQLLVEKLGMVNEMKRKGHSNSAIAKHMGISEASVRTFLNLSKSNPNKTPKEKRGKQTS